MGVNKTFNQTKCSCFYLEPAQQQGSQFSYSVSSLRQLIIVLCTTVAPPALGQGRDPQCCVPTRGRGWWGRRAGCGPREGLGAREALGRAGICSPARGVHIQASFPPPTPLRGDLPVTQTISEPGHWFAHSPGAGMTKPPYQLLGSPWDTACRDASQLLQT